MENIKVGDKVLVHHGSGFNHHYTIWTISGETPTQWICGHLRFYKKNGRQVGDKWRTRIEELTPEAQARYDEQESEKLHSKLWRDIREIKQPKHLSVQRLQEIYDELANKSSTHPAG